jgi:hypothetical protein
MFRDLSFNEACEFRQWARDNYKTGEPISGIWHPIVQDECTKMNKEAAVFMKDEVSL